MRGGAVGDAAMLSTTDNELLTRTGPGTPGGAMMRAYRQPVALSRELEADVPLAVRAFSEDLVLFRDGAGKPQLIGRYCPHRLVDLSYGRVEAGGLVFAYLGAGAPPRRPQYEFFALDPKYVWAGKLHHDCNWLQGHEGNVDPQHLSYLHRYLSQAEALDPKGNLLFGGDVAPSIEPEETAYGMRIKTVRGAPGGAKYVRI